MGADMDGVSSLVKTTDRMADAWTGRVQFKVQTGRLDYAVVMEYGSRPHVIEPDDADVLKFTVDGVTVYTDHVDHPGTEPQPYMQPAAEGAARMIHEAAARSDDLEELAKEAAKIVSRLAKQKAPKDTGRLALSIHYERVD